MMLEWIIPYLEPLIFFLIAVVALRIWSATELKKKEIEEYGKAQRSQINVDGKTETARYDAMQYLREVSDMEGGDDETAQLMGLMNLIKPEAKPVGESAVINELQEFAKTEKGADAMAQFTEFQKNK